MKRNKGFSLIEILITISLISILIAVLTPNIKTWRDNQRLSASAESIRSLFERAKMEAIKNQANVAISFNTGIGSAGSYVMFLDNGATQQTLDAGEPILRRGSVETEVTLYSAAFPGITNVAVVNQMGLASGSSGSISIRNAAGDLYKQIQLSDSGVVKILRSPTGNTGSWVD